MVRRFALGEEARPHVAEQPIRVWAAIDRLIRDGVEISADRDRGGRCILQRSFAEEQRHLFDDANLFAGVVNDGQIGDDLLVGDLWVFPRPHLFCDAIYFVDDHHFGMLPQKKVPVVPNKSRHFSTVREL